MTNNNTLIFCFTNGEMVEIQREDIIDIIAGRIKYPTLSIKNCIIDLIDNQLVYDEDVEIIKNNLDELIKKIERLESIGYGIF